MRLRNWLLGAAFVLLLSVNGCDEMAAPAEAFCMPASVHILMRLEWARRLTQDGYGHVTVKDVTCPIEAAP